MKNIGYAISSGCVLFGSLLFSVPAFAEDEVAALVIDNGVSVPEPSALAALGAGIAVLGLKRYWDRHRK